MKKIKIFEPAMCCETGLCGVSVDPELLRISTVINTLKERGIIVERYNFSSNPQAFIDYKLVNEFVNKYGVENLPITLVEEEIKIIGHYPSNEEFTNWLEISSDILNVQAKENGCCSKGGCC